MNDEKNPSGGEIRRHVENLGWIVPGLVGLLRSESPQRQVDIAVALGNIGPAAEAAVLALTELYEHGPRGVQNYAAWALWKITGQVRPLKEGGFPVEQKVDPISTCTIVWVKPKS